MHGDPLLAADALEAVRTVLIPRATVVTPNLDEVRLITGIEVTDAASQREAAHRLLALGAQWALVKGGHLRDCPDSPDLLTDGAESVEFTAPRVPTGHDHGAGDTLAAAITAALAHGRSVPAAVEFGKAWVTEGLRWAYPLGAGHGPVNPLWSVRGPGRVDPRSLRVPTTRPWGLGSSHALDVGASTQPSSGTPASLHARGPEGLADESHAGLGGSAIGLAVVALSTARDEVRPRVAAAPRPREDVVDRGRPRATARVLAHVSVAPQDLGTARMVGDTAVRDGRVPRQQHRLRQLDLGAR
ncbi:hypothetical protein MTP03_42120 [Tsukamurella sp. PLM1]|nr:hypothetical protein MTP03_42120 [Tsukamurella sp. PLM1]